jgi:DNA-binding NarL/FixJ family response regulator
MRLKILHRSRLFRESLAAVLSQRAGFVAEAIDHALPDCLDAIKSPPPSIVLIDVKLPRKMAVRLVTRIRQEGIAARILLLVASRDCRYLLECIESGIHGCILADSSLAHLVEAIERAIEGDMFCSPEILEALSKRLSRRKSKP